MGNIRENREEVYNWDSEPVYLIEEDDYVEGGEDGVSNRQAKQLTRRTRDLFNRISEVLKKLIKGDSDTLESANSFTSQTATTLRSEITTSSTATLNKAKDYTSTTVAALVDSSPETLNTLNELATALGGDPNFATTVATQIGNKVDNSDPRLTDARPANGGSANYATRLMTNLDASMGVTFDGVSRWKLDVNHSLCKDVRVAYAETSEISGTANYLQWLNPDGTPAPSHYLKFVRTNPVNSDGRLYLQAGDREFNSISVAYADTADSASASTELRCPDNGQGNLIIGTSRGLLTGYPSNYYPTIKTSFSNIYFDVGGKYVGVIGKSNVDGLEISDSNNKGIKLSHNNGTPATVYCGDISSSGHTVYHAGNLTTASAGSDGLMSRQDKSKLNDTPRVVAHGEVDRLGNIVWQEGDEPVSIYANTTAYTIYHNVGKEAYSVQVSLVLPDVASWGLWHLALSNKTNNSITVTVRDTLDDNRKQCGFFFTIFAK
ncbi:MAG: hypothetical protein RR277_00450 [Rikenellaceae bacterium]